MIDLSLFGKRFSSGAGILSLMDDLANAPASGGIDYLIHVPEGAMFLWIWFRDLPITSRALYERLKKRRVLVVSGFFPRH